MFFMFIAHECSLLYSFNFYLMCFGCMYTIILLKNDNSYIIYTSLSQSNKNIEKLQVLKAIYLVTKITDISQ